MSRELGVQFARQGIRVNALCPGPVNTPLLRELFAKDPERAARRLVHIPVGRFAEADEIAAAVAFLASDDSSFITASQFLVDGGISGAYVTPLWLAARDTIVSFVVSDALIAAILEPLMRADRGACRAAQPSSGFSSASPVSRVRASRRWRWRWSERWPARRTGSTRASRICRWTDSTSLTSSWAVSACSTAKAHRRPSTRTATRRCWPGWPRGRPSGHRPSNGPSSSR